MIDALVSGRLRGAVNLRTSNTGNPFAVWRMATTDKNGDSVLCSCIAFSTTAIDAAQRLSDGDSIAVSGEAAISTWNGNGGTLRHGLDVLVHGVLTAYHLGRKRKASEPTGGDDERGPL
ncbi:MAG: single-stranded DNA-binding protein [Betaproteobacteria bacterium HGW-Betaproteobacteria-9]|jgi:single-stranded DNA-binding protein|nr:MAG: single-stranded DNA-binding protein [Betaproteobacteria bacterium HGW-Betaproteobacteria-9]